MLAMIRAPSAAAAAPRGVSRTSFARPVQRVGDALRVAEAVEVVDRREHRRLGEACLLGEIGKARPVSLCVLEDAPVRRADVGEARDCKLRVQARKERLERMLEELCQVERGV
jgi:hypothetical protein